MTSFPHSLVLDSYISYTLVHLYEICCKTLSYINFGLFYKEHVKVFNLFPLKKLNEYVIWKEKKHIPNVIVWIARTTVSHPLFECFMHSLSGTGPFNTLF